MPKITPIETRMKSIDLGMGKDKVIQILGKDYQVVGRSMALDGEIETMGYYDYTNGMYKLHIQNGILVEWEYSPGIKYNFSRHPE